MEYQLHFESIKSTPIDAYGALCAFNCDYTLKGVVVNNLPLWIEVTCEEEQLENDFVKNHIEIIENEVTKPRNHEFTIFKKPFELNDDYFFYYWVHYFDAIVYFENKKIKLTRSNISISRPLLDFIKVFE